jgi:LysR family transcriptional regulator, regulator of abg operon
LNQLCQNGMYETRHLSHAMSLNVDDLRCFATVARLGSLSAAALELGWSQPTVSKSMARLQRQTKTPLLERAGRGVRLSVYGQSILAHAQQIDLDAQDLMAQLRDLRQHRRGSLRMGLGQGVPDRWVLPVMRSMQERAAGSIQWHVAGGMTDILLQQLRTGELDVIVIGAPSQRWEGLRWTQLRADPMVPCAPIGHALLQSQSIRAEFLAKQAWIVPTVGTFTHSEFLDYFKAAKLPAPQPMALSASSQRDIQMAQTLQTLILLPHCLLGEPAIRAAFAPLSLKRAWASKRQLGLLQRKGLYQNPLAEQFSVALRQQMLLNP